MEYLITPLIDSIKTMAITYQHKVCVDSEDIQLSKLLLINETFGKLISIIDNKKLHNDILKYISPHFFVNSKPLVLE
jgi:hypothetical protein